MAEITSLSSLAKTSVATTDFLLVANSTTKAAKKFQLSSLFPSVSTGGAGSEALYTSATLTNKNQIVFKGLKSADAKVTVTTATDNLIITLVEAQIDLNACDNSSAGFLKNIDFDTVTMTNELGVANGGTGLSSIAKGALLYASATDTISATAAMSTNGQLLIGNTTNGYPSVATLTAGSNVTITNGAGSITIAATLATLAANLDTDSYNIDLNTNYISDDGSDRGIYVHTNGKTILNDTGSTLTTSEAVAQLNLQGNNAQAIRIGNPGASQSTYFIKTIDGTGGSAGSRFYMSAGSGDGNGAGASIALLAGASPGSGAGGDALIEGGDSDSGTPGDVILSTYNSSGTSGSGLVVAGDTRDTSVYANLFVVNNPVYARGGFRNKQAAVPVLADNTDALTTAQVLTGVLKITPTADRTKATPTATNLVTDLSLTSDNDSFDFTIVNLATDGTSDLTLSAGVGVTIIGSPIVKSRDDADDAGYSGSGLFRIRRSSSSTIDLIRIA
jgi:hypothetical protein